MTDQIKFFSENVERHATSRERPLEYNEQRGFLAMSEAIAHIQMQLDQVSQEMRVLHQGMEFLSQEIQKR